MSSTYRKKSGRPVPEDYTNPLFQHSLTQVTRSLKTKYASLMLTEAIVATHVLDFITFMDVRNIFYFCIFFYCVIILINVVL